MPLPTLQRPQPKSRRSRQPQSSPEPKRLRPLTPERLAVIESLSDYGILDTHQLTRIRLGKRKCTVDEEHTTNKMLKALREAKLVRTRPDGKDVEESRVITTFSAIHGLTGSGVEFAKEMGYPDPKEFERERKLINLVHDLKRADTHEKIEWLCDDNGWGLGWKKTGLYRKVEPDDWMWIIKPERRLNLFLEEENEKKTHKSLYDKARRYADLFDTEECQKLWGFRKFYVIFRHSNEERMRNLMRYLKGECLCVSRKHTCLPALKLAPVPEGRRRSFLFVHDRALEPLADGQAFDNLKGEPVSLLDL